MIIDCIADLHGHYPELEGGDLLIVVGDLTATDTVDEHAEFAKWVQKQDYRSFILVAGNHDGFLYNGFHEGRRLGPKGRYLCDSGTEFEYLDIGSDGVTIVKRTLKIWGSPWTLTFPGINPKCTAFTGTESQLREKFDLIPDDIDILITHGPMKGILDRSVRGEECGSLQLILATYKSKMKLHVFGHIHESYGKLIDGPLTHINCSHVNEHYEPVNKPIRIIL